MQCMIAFDLLNEGEQLRGAPGPRSHVNINFKGEKHQMPNDSSTSGFVLNWVNWKVKVNSNARRWSVFHNFYAVIPPKVDRNSSFNKPGKYISIQQIELLSWWLQWLLNSSTKTWCLILIKAIINGLIGFQHSIKINKHYLLQPFISNKNHDWLSNENQKS